MLFISPTVYLQNDTEENRVYLKKRLMVGSAISWKLWPNATVPYCYDPDLRMYNMFVCLFMFCFFKLNYELYIGS